MQRGGETPRLLVNAAKPLMLEVTATGSLTGSWVTILAVAWPQQLNGPAQASSRLKSKLAVHAISGPTDAQE